jgi:hypothetical protein
VDIPVARGIGLLTGMADVCTSNRLRNLKLEIHNVPDSSEIYVEGQDSLAEVNWTLVLHLIM